MHYTAVGVGPVGGGLIHSGEGLDIMIGKATWWGKTEQGMYGRANGKTACKWVLTRVSPSPLVTEIMAGRNINNSEQWVFKISKTVFGVCGHVPPCLQNIS